jgi:RND superfamily putative drug exporter
MAEFVANASDAAICRLLAGGPLPTEAIADRLAMPDRTVRYRLARLRQAGVVVTDPDKLHHLAVPPLPALAEPAPALADPALAIAAPPLPALAEPAPALADPALAIAAPPLPAFADPVPAFADPALAIAAPPLPAFADPVPAFADPALAIAAPVSDMAAATDSHQPSPSHGGHWSPGTVLAAVLGLVAAGVVAVALGIRVTPPPPAPSPTPPRPPTGFGNEGDRPGGVGWSPW